METYYNLGINWTWYLICTQETTGVRITALFRRHNTRDSHPDVKFEESFSLVENAQRTVTGVFLKGILYPVINPQHIFSYGEPR